MSQFFWRVSYQGPLEAQVAPATFFLEQPAILIVAVQQVGQTFVSAGSGDFPVARTGVRGWKAP